MIAWILVLAESVTPATIDVVGKRREREHPERPGASVIIHPDGATRFDTATALRAEPSVAVPETGRLNAAGFALPRIRGQDARLTAVYVEDLLLQDPLTGLPLTDEIDLRAFGELALHRGLPPPALPTVSPTGAMQFRVRPGAESRLTLGGTAGNPYGVSTFAVGDHHREAGQDGVLTFRGYAREHRTNGEYPYYSDNGTPYNAADDRTLTRQSNGRSSRQAMPYALFRDGKNTVQILAMWSESTTGIPVLGANGASAATEAVSANLGTVKWRRAIAEGQEIAVTVAATEDARGLDDTERLVSGARGNAHARVSSRRGVVAYTLGLGNDESKLVVSAERAKSRIHTRTVADDRTALKREATTVYAGMTLRPGDSDWQIEAKGLARRQDERGTQGGGLALGYAFPVLSLYTQGASEQRPPSLLEEQGDGALIRPKPEIKPERIQHAEAGANAAFGIARGNVALFQDDTRDKIIFVPSLGQSLRAENVARTRVRGAEAAVEVAAGDYHASLGAAHMTPEDITRANRPRQLPGIAATVVVAQAWTKVLDHATPRWSARHQSETYRDLDNAIVVPAYWIHDASFDVAWKPWEAGLQILNVFDVRDLAIAARDTPESRGKTAYSDLAGYPLPGRQWRITVAATF